MRAHSVGNAVLCCFSGKNYRLLRFFMFPRLLEFFTYFCLRFELKLITSIVFEKHTSCENATT